MLDGKKEDGARKEEQEDVEWPQLPDTFEQIAKAVVTPVKSEERKKRLGISE